MLRFYCHLAHVQRKYYPKGFTLPPGKNPPFYAGDVNISIRDYAVCLQVFLKGLKGEDTLVPAETIKYLLYGNMGKSSYNIGWGSRKIDGYTYSIHNGSAGTFFARAAVIKELNLAAAIFVSSASPGALKGVRELMDKFAGFYIKK